MDPVRVNLPPDRAAPTSCSFTGTNDPSPSVPGWSNLPRMPTPSRRLPLLSALAAVLVLAGLLMPSVGHASDLTAADVLEWVNDRRDEAGLRRLLPTAHLDRVATSHSVVMADQQHLHHNPDLADDVRDWQRLSENVGVGGDVAAVLEALWESVPHRENLLDPDMVGLGVGIVEGADGRQWLTQVFREPVRSRYDLAGGDASRVQGDSAHATSVAASRRTFTSAEVVYLARVDQLADAVAGGVLTKGPVLLVPSCGAVPDVVTSEIQRVDPTRVTALGGPSAICEDLLRTAARGRTATRLAGPDRYATSVAVSREQFDRADVAYLARGDVFSDAVAGGALTDGPVLLVPSCGPPTPVVRDELDRLGVERVVALGGRTAICDTTLAAAAAGRTSDRLAGRDRHDTAARIARHASGGDAPTVLLARSDELADAVIAGMMTAGPILLVPPCGTLPPVVADTIASLGADEVLTVGGPTAVCDDLVGQAVHHTVRG